MATSLDVQKVGVKFLLADPANYDLLSLIPVFHRWIQTKALDGLLIDVADYSHLEQGPGIMLITHEGDFSFDLAGGRAGMMYRRKQPLDGSLGERLVEICRICLGACALLEADSEAGSLVFRSDTLTLTAYDRLLAPNEESTRTELESVLATLAGALFGEGPHVVEVERPSSEPFSVRVSAGNARGSEGISGLLSRLER